MIVVGIFVQCLVYPETIPIAQQITTIDLADMLAGIDGENVALTYEFFLVFLAG